jgi:hypothetical protein
MWSTLIWDSMLTPKIPWDQKLVDCCLGSMCEEKLIFFNFFFWMSELHISQAFCEHQARPIPTPYEPVVNFCWKRVLSSFFMYFLRSYYMQPCGQNWPRVEGQGAKIFFCFAHKILVFYFFKLFFGSWFYMMSPSMSPIWSKCKVFDFFQEIVQGP